MHGDGEFNCLCQVILWIQRKTFTRSHPYLFCEPCRSRSSAICDAESRECKRDDKGLEPFQNCVFSWGRTHTKIQLDSIISHWKNKDISPNFKKKIACLCKNFWKQLNCRPKVTPKNCIELPFKMFRDFESWQNERRNSFGIRIGHSESSLPLKLGKSWEFSVISEPCRFFTP